MPDQQLLDAFLAKSRLDEIERRLDAATPGPWHNETGQIRGNGGPVLLRAHGIVTWQGVRGWQPEQAMADLEFAAEAREDVPYLLNRVRELEAELRHRAERDRL